MSPPTSTPGGARLIPLRDFFRNPEQSRFQVSPDGNSISFMRPWYGRMNVFVRPRVGGEAVRVTSETERDVADYFWKGSGRIVYLKDFKGDENFHVVAGDIPRAVHRALYTEVNAQQLVTALSFGRPITYVAEDEVGDPKRLGDSWEVWKKEAMENG